MGRSANFVARAVLEGKKKRNYISKNSEYQKEQNKSIEFMLTDSEVSQLSEAAFGMAIIN